MLLRTLIQLSLMMPGAAVPQRSLQILQRATEQQWQVVLSDLALHRQMPLMFITLKAPELRDAVPKPVLMQLMQSYMYSLRRNTVLYKTLGTVLKETYAAGIYPVLWKGIVLADQMYPDIAVRMIGDIDWAIAPHELQVVERIFTDLEFELKPELSTTDAVYFKGKDHVFFDVHHRVRLFEGKEHLSLTAMITPRMVGLPSLHVLEPNAMLTHLTVHLKGHSSETGPMLFWVLDFVFLLRQWGDQIDIQRLNDLMPDEECWHLLGRILRFLQVECEETLPPALALFAQGYKPLTLELITRQCRLASWNLSRPKGWLKLAACRLGLKARALQRYPQASDLLLWAADR
jgi:Uncharacterised nucleotidyltransferase